MDTNKPIITCNMEDIVVENSELQEQNEDKGEKSDNENDDKSEKKLGKNRKQRGNVMTTEELAKTGIIYLSRIPTLMNKDILRQYFSNFGDVNRIWLELDTKAPQRGRRLVYAEGWIEFKDKKIAKQVAKGLNNTQVGGKKRYAWSEEIWNIKYLHRFKWVHLHERLTHEKAVHHHRMRTEIAQAKRESNFYIESSDKSERLRRLAKKKDKPMKDGQSSEKKEETKEKDTEGKSEKVFQFRLKETEEEIVGDKRKRAEKFKSKNKKFKRNKQERETNEKSVNKNFLTKIFGGSASKVEEA